MEAYLREAENDNTSYGEASDQAVTLSWLRGKQYLRFGGSVIRHTSGGTGSEPGPAILGPFPFLTTGT